MNTPQKLDFRKVKFDHINRKVLLDDNWIDEREFHLKYIDCSAEKIAEEKMINLWFEDIIRSYRSLTSVQSK